MKKFKKIVAFYILTFIFAFMAQCGIRNTEPTDWVLFFSGVFITSIILFMIFCIIVWCIKTIGE